MKKIIAKIYRLVAKSLVGTGLSKYSVFVNISRFLTVKLNPDFSNLYEETFNKCFNFFTTNNRHNLIKYVKLLNKFLKEGDIFKIPRYLQKMVDNKCLGQKSKQGFYKKIDKGVIHSIDLETLEYSPQMKNV